MTQQSVFKLCYIDGDCAFFTTQALDEQWGDDWNDMPYECNASSPHRWDETDGVPKWEILIIRFYGDFEQPSEGYINSPYSVEMINNKECAWLKSSESGEELMAGATPVEFMTFIQNGGGCYRTTPDRKVDSMWFPQRDNNGNPT